MICKKRIHMYNLLIRRIHFTFINAPKVPKQRFHLVFGGIGCNVGDLNHLCCYFLRHSVADAMNSFECYRKNVRVTNSTLKNMASKICYR